MMVAREGKTKDWQVFDWGGGGVYTWYHKYFNHGLDLALNWKWFSQA